jgi:tyrosine-protein phosphatase non-receptor type 23
VENLKTLSKPLAELQKDIPSLADLDPEAEAAIAEFQRLIKKVDEMKKQRETLIDKVRVEILNDDITKKLVLHKDKELPEIFAEELKKHDTYKGYIEQNLNAQTNIIKAITEVNAK